jgi:hypothetical protein
MIPKGNDSGLEEQTMNDILRRSPIEFHLKPTATEQHGDSLRVADYGLEGLGPWLVDLSLIPKWDLQDSNLDAFQPSGLAIPPTPGDCRFEKGILVNRMNQTQCSIWVLNSDNLEVPQETAYTEVTDGLCLLALCGEGTLEVMERITTLDLGDPQLNPPRLLQGPILNVPCQTVLLRRQDDDATILFSFPRGYGQSMADAVLEVAKDLKLQPAGEKNLNLGL